MGAQPAPIELIQNGSFETGDFTGWNAVNPAGPFAPWGVVGAGSGFGFGLQTTVPQDGNFVAVNGFDAGGPDSFNLFQQVSIPSGHDAILTFDYRLQWANAFRPAFAASRELELQILDPGSNQILSAPFHTAVGPLLGAVGDINTGWLTKSVDLSIYSGMDVIINFSAIIPGSFTGPAQMEIDSISLTVFAVHGPTVSHLDDVEVIIGNSPAPIPFFIGAPGFNGQDIEVKIESDNQFILSNDDILHGRPGDEILLGEDPHDRILPGGEFFPENPPPFGGGNDLLGAGGPIDELLGQGIPVDQIDRRVIILPTLRRLGSANLTITATNPNGITENFRFGVNVISDEVIIIDDGDPGFATQGNWGDSNALGAYNGDSLFSDQPGSKAIFTPELPGAGTFAVYARWAGRQANGPGNYDRDQGARFVVNHVGGATSTMIDQNRGGGRFNLLGIFDFSGDGNENVTLERVNVLGGFTSADAVRFVSSPSTDGNEQPGDLIVDNLSLGFSTSGAWHESNANDEYAGSSLFTEVNGNMAAFSAGVALDGIQEVYVRSSGRSPRGGFYNRDSQAQYQVKHANGTAMVKVNQNVLPGQWVFVGAYPFSAENEASVKLTRNNDDTSQKTSADAVRFTALQPVRSNEVIIDNQDAGFTSFGNWIESNALDEYLQSSLAGFGFGTTAKWTPELPAAGKYQVFAHWANQRSDGPAPRDSKAWYEVRHGGQKTTVRINQNKNGGNWTSIGTFDFVADGSEFVELFHGFQDNAAVSADAIRFLLVD
ncbi:MAG: hypothetical protein HOH33_05085 [Verrucomicrobia bacterium]|nr:hypothetical protein [Verrucomicrobiota bacterium]